MGLKVSNKNRKKEQVVVVENKPTTVIPNIKSLADECSFGCGIAVFSTVFVITFVLGIYIL